MIFFRGIGSLVAMMVCVCALKGQTYIISFSGVNLEGLPAQLEKVVITNATQHWTDTIYFPDSTYVLINSTGVMDMNDINPFSVTSATPNPFQTTTCMRVQGATPGPVAVKITNQNGVVVASSILECGECGELPLRVTLASGGLYILTVSQNGRSASAKLLNIGHGERNIIERDDFLGVPSPSKTCGGFERASFYHPAKPTDQMIYVGYTIHEGEEIASASVKKGLHYSHDIVLTFPYTYNGLPCEGEPTVTDVDGNVYNTVRIGTQCCMKENLRTTHLANGDSILFQTTVHGYGRYRYAPDNDTANVPMFGYYYNWEAANALFYGCTPHQGACPTGWRMPTFDELNQLFSHVQSIYIYHCDGNPKRYAKALADSVGWNPRPYSCCPGNDPGTNNATGFSLRPAGYFSCAAHYWGFGGQAYLWSSTEVFSYGASVSAYCRIVDNIPEFPTYNADNYAYDKHSGMSVRCIKN